jgi:hypothetical protein
MKAMATIALVCALSSLFAMQGAEAAVTCVENKTTGRFDEKVQTRGRATGECEAQTFMNNASSVAEIEEASSADGTKIIDGIVVTNAAKPFGAVGNTKKENVAGTHVVAEADSVGTLKPISAAAKAAVAQEAQAKAAAALAAQESAKALPPNQAGKPQGVVVARPAGPEKRTWDVRVDDQSIYRTLSRWAAQANPKRQIAWEIPREFEVSAGDSGDPFFGTFEEAVDRVLDSYESSDYPPKGCFYSNGVVRVVRRIGDGMECKR